jgi:hypothetical protein
MVGLPQFTVVVRTVGTIREAAQLPEYGFLVRWIILFNTVSRQILL